MNPPIRIVIVEDDSHFREGLKFMLSISPGFECVGDYSNGKEFLKRMKNNIPDVILMDIDIPEMNGLECTKIIKANNQYSAVHIIMLTILEDEYKVLEAILAGASGYLLKSASPENITDSIRQVTNGGSPMSPSVASKVFGLLKLNYTITKEKILLNKREAEVLEGLVEGLTYKMIGAKYFISVDTVRTYIRGIYEKLRVHSRSEAIVKAIRQRLI
jgi:DNA-binding NarL/FixJ family response regulator